jgi:oligopeptide transport system substrate-binding protein
MRRKYRSAHLVACLIALASASCTSLSAGGEYFGQTDPPDGQVMRYVTGSEPETLDPQYGTGQPEARIYMALYEGLTTYHPQTMEPIPGVAERWEVNEDSSEFVFYLRRNARWSNGDPVTAHDFTFSFRRALSPALASRNAYMSYEIKYAQAYNEGLVFVRNAATGRFLLQSDLGSPAEDASQSLRVTLPGDEAGREKALEANARLREAARGMEFVPVRGEDIGVEALDDYTFRVELVQPAPYFVGMLAHQVFMPVHRRTLETHGDAWTRPANIVTNGPFKVETWQPYDKLILVRDPMYWDARVVRLDRITFYPMEEATTIMNLYKAGAIDAFLNHSVPISWLDVIRPKLDYMNTPENAIEYYMFNTTRPPMDDVRVRKAFNAAIDKAALAEYRRITKPLTAFTPEGIFQGYPQPKGDPFDPERARRLLAEAGYGDAAGAFDPARFPVNEIELLYNTSESNRQVAEFVQAQWKQHLGLTVPLRNMEWMTYLDARSRMEYKGFARAGWVGDYMDPYTFLSLLLLPGGNNGTGWWDKKFVGMLNEANHELDPMRRYELLAKAEAYMLEAQPVIPLQTPATNWMKKPYVKGMYPNAGTLHPWKFVYIEHDPSKWDRGIPTLTQ